ncbi:undecaprenyldiphospho-muramoylpentapeptide beta-N-acetylglucosaminyltransferase [Arthrobacter roseus]|uniref:undecaprenyldiphospho-muramoylpentapeptide beta-N-acetylglucosaminyltransferase n=1 Tax=Arthrobacter roseus TaxID=136274 RepID=UPI0019653569|nr:undecaprenyldiphospho-muramoylpentapeptide beta-N-acetylglucosaminyltransferase [Arthrobacter roseus]MBM7848334.1 UDP-N-acetylglucosamine--N-acetylmuramyl-(pentapeptide) pyrophosphoryl-undecaprenol N-acetylglucosamine transferase [Arthrobacter roseus]
MNDSTLSVVLAGGGTAGHVGPLLAIAAALAQLRPGTRIAAVGTDTGMETRLVPAAGLPLQTIDRVPMPRSLSIDLLKLPLRFVRAIGQSVRVLRTAKADVVVGVGGYVCTPVYIAAALLRIPLVIHEANVRAGLANRVGAFLARRIGVAFASTGLRRAEWVGMPMSREISGLDRAATRETARLALGLVVDMPTVVVTGGSSGAATMNSAVAASLDHFAAAGVQVLHITGRGKAIVDESGAQIGGTHYHQVEYVNGMESAYAAGDILIARAGAGTVSEVCAVGLPSVLVPLPHGNGEQALNAGALVAAGGALLVTDQEFTSEWINEELLPLATDDVRLSAMSSAALSLGSRDAAEQMAQMILAESGVQDA